MAKLAFFVLLKTMVKKDKKGGYKCSPWAMGAWIRWADDFGIFPIGKSSTTGESVGNLFLFLRGA